MKLVSFCYRNQQGIGVINEQSQIVDLTYALSAKHAPLDMIDFIRLGRAGLVACGQGTGSRQ